MNDWQLEFEYVGSGPWSEHFVVDGVRAEIQQTDAGFIFASGPVPLDAGCNTVMWTRRSFAGDLRMEFDYTRLDTMDKYATLLYFQARGIGDMPEDITEWADRRIVPIMRTYFQNMDLLHLSFAALREDGDYLRVRRYPATPERPFDRTEVGEAVFNTGLFIPGVRYRMTVTKTDAELAVEVSPPETDDAPFSHTWSLADEPPTGTGPIGIRQMHARCARYENVRIWTRSR